MIGIVADSAALVDMGAAEARHIHFVPMQVFLDGTNYADGSVGVDRVIEALGNGSAGSVKTAAPSPGAFVEAIGRADDGEGVVVLTVSAKMSSSHDSAAMAAGMSGAKVEVFDTGTAAGAEGLVVSAAVREALAGGSLDAVVKRAMLARDSVRLVAEVGDLSALARGGRLPARLARLGDSVGLRPVFQFRRGSIRVLRPALSAQAATRALISSWRASIRPSHRLHVVANFATDRTAAETLLEQVAAEVEPSTGFVTQFGPVMVAHTGTDIVGLSWWWEPNGR